MFHSPHIVHRNSNSQCSDSSSMKANPNAVVLSSSFESHLGEFLLVSFLPPQEIGCFYVHHHIDPISDVCLSLFMRNRLQL